ncbi:MAG TPA: hypothetical protein VFQ78_15860 [Candidatus Udaeobacter sp.]|nr:hypothetical protein [Candidatus Udaeobacter sp.]
MKTSRIGVLLFGCVFAGMILLGSSAHAALMFSDSFDYSVGSLSGDGPPPGSPPGQTGWSASSGNPLVSAPGLRFRGLTSTGNATTITGVLAANGDVVTAGLSNLNHGKVWIGFLARLAHGSAAQGFSVLFLDGPGGGPSFGLLFNSGVYGIDNNTGGAGFPTTVAPSRTTVWLVVELDFTSGMELLFIDPTRNSPPAAQAMMTPSFQASGFDSIGLAGGYNTASFNFDEVRVGRSLNDIMQ